MDKFQDRFTMSGYKTLADQTAQNIYCIDFNICYCFRINVGFGQVKVRIVNCELVHSWTKVAKGNSESKEISEISEPY